MKVFILSSSRKIYDGESKEVTLPGKGGQMQILEDHSDLFALLTKGDIIVGRDKKIPIFSGLAEVSNNKVDILVEEL